jgi:hypothetical protein
VHERLADAPLAGCRRPVQELVVDAGEQTAQPTERGLREREDARGLIGVGRERGEGELLFLQRVEQRIGRIRRRIDITPAPRDAGIGDTRESRQRAVEG